MPIAVHLSVFHGIPGSEVEFGEEPAGGIVAVKGGVICDPHHLSKREQEQICRGWVRQLSTDIGPLIDVPAPDVRTNAQHMLWMLDEYETIHRKRMPGLITGKPVRLGGSLGRTEATGYGVVFAVREALKELGMTPAATCASVQGFGNVAQYAIRLYQQIGGKVICVSCWDQNDQTSYAFRREAGVDMDALVGITDRFGGIDTGRDSSVLGSDDQYHGKRDRRGNGRSFWTANGTFLKHMHSAEFKL